MTQLDFVTAMAFGFVACMLLNWLFGEPSK
jgi:hypothetical protein